jgi:hypothetical protein
MNYWIFSNKAADYYGARKWDTVSILKSKRWYFGNDNPNVWSVEDGDHAIFRIYSNEYIARFKVRGEFTKDPSERGIGYFRMTNLTMFDPGLPQQLVQAELSNQNVRNKIISVTKDDFDRIELARRIYTRMGGSGMPFPGIHEINHRFSVLEKIFEVGRIDWKAALKDMKGVYLITDTSNGKKYVGSAYGGAGLWSRWGCYIGTGHGWNDELVRLIRRRGLSYARRNFNFSILEAMAKATADEVVISRETYWKQVLLTRDRDHGYNRN